jgi:hypothetical protein
MCNNYSLQIANKLGNLKKKILMLVFVVAETFLIEQLPSSDRWNVYRHNEKYTKYAVEMGSVDSI